MVAFGQRSGRARSVAGEAVGRRWPSASPDTVTKLVRASSTVDQAKGVLLAQGERPSRVALVLSGTFVATWSAPDGRIAQGRIVRVNVSGRGHFLGVTTLTGGAIEPGIDALTEATMLTWSSREFRAITDADLAVALDLLDQSIYAIRLLNHGIQLRTFTTAATRLAGVLLENEALCFSRDAPLVARGQLSALAGVTPQMVSRILRKWEAAAVVRRVGMSGLELLDRGGLQAEAAPLDDFPPPERRSQLTVAS
jgi:CRP-like cAMP-binding protein